MHEYDALGNRVRTTYYTRKSLTAVPIGNILHPENNVSDYTVGQARASGEVCQAIGHFIKQ